MREETQQRVGAGTAEPASTAPKVLIFDEDRDDMSRLAEPFENYGFEVYKCMSVEAAMRCVEREEFDFALVDQVSPAFEGLGVIRHLVRYNPHTPFMWWGGLKIRCVISRRSHSERWTIWRNPFPEQR